MSEWLISSLGCDVSHPPPNIDTRPSVASVVASVDSRAAFYTAAIQVQPPHVEMIQNLRDMVWVEISYIFKSFLFLSEVFLLI